MTRRTTNGIRRTSGGIGRTTPIITTNVIDDFEDGDMSEWTLVRGGSTSTTTSPVRNGTYAGAVSVDASQLILTTITSMPGDGLPNYPDPGDRWNVFFYVPSGSLSTYETRSRWAVQSTNANPDRYEAGVDYANNELYIGKNDNSGDGFSQLVSTSLSATPTDEWVRLRHVWQTDGDLLAEFYDAAGNSLGNTPVATDTTYSDGGISIVARNDNDITLYIDDMEEI